MEKQNKKQDSQTTIQRLMDPAAVRSRSAKEVSLAIVGAVALLAACAVGIYLYHSFESGRGAPNDVKKMAIGNGNSERSLKQQDDSTDGRPSNPSEQHAISPLENKLNGYVDCLNRFEDIRKAMRQYFSWRKDGLAPPTCHERRVKRGIAAVYQGHVPECETLVDAASRMSPDIPELHKAGKKYVKMLGKTMPLMKQMSAYYAKKRYTDDDCFKGKIYHVQVMKLFVKLTEAEKKLRHLVAAQAKGGLQACVKRTAARPEKAALHAWASLIETAQNAVNRFRLETQHITLKRNGGPQLIDGLKTQMAAFESLPEEMTDTHDGELFDDFIATATAFHTQNDSGQSEAKPLGIRIRNGTPVAVQTGSLEHVLDMFHHLIKRYNFWAKNNCVMLLPCNDDNTCPER